LSFLCGRPRPGRKRVDRPVCVLTKVDLKQHSRYRYGDLAEALARAGSLRVMATGGKPFGTLKSAESAGTEGAAR
jgi:hypothetical protein